MKPLKHLIIGAADNYSWKDIRVWATSLTLSGFQGDIVLIAYRVTPDVLERCMDLGITVIRPEHNEMAELIDYTSHGLPTVSHKLRNFHIWQYLDELDDETYEIVAINDVRDIVYQTKPDIFFDAAIHSTLDESVWMPSENVLFKDEPWNDYMVRSLFGPYVSQKLQDKVTCNSGTVFGTLHAMKQFSLQMYLTERTFKVTGCDQPTMNVLGYTAMPSLTIDVLPHDVGYACQCGTTLDPTKSFPQAGAVPVVKNGVVYTSTDQPYVLVHQYDRVPELKPVIESRFV